MWVRCGSDVGQMWVGCGSGWGIPRSCPWSGRISPKIGSMSTLCPHHQHSVCLERSRVCHTLIWNDKFQAWFIVYMSRKVTWLLAGFSHLRINNNRVVKNLLQMHDFFFSAYTLNGIRLSWWNISRHCAPSSSCATARRRWKPSFRDHILIILNCSRVYAQILCRIILLTTNSNFCNDFYHERHVIKPVFFIVFLNLNPLNTLNPWTLNPP